MSQFAVASQDPAIDGHAALAEYLSKFELEQFTDELVALGATKPSDLMHVTSEDLTQMGMSSYEQARLEENLAPRRPCRCGKLCRYMYR